MMGSATDSNLCLLNLSQEIKEENGECVFDKLPPELVAIIFRKLDSESLVNVVASCKRFSQVCRADQSLRFRIVDELRRQKMFANVDVCDRVLFWIVKTIL